MAKVDLENDIANSNLSEALYAHYCIFDKDLKSLVSKMQKSKAKNMFDFVEEMHSKLQMLNDDELIEPIDSIVTKVKSQVQYNGK